MRSATHFLNMRTRAFVSILSMVLPILLTASSSEAGHITLESGEVELMRVGRSIHILEDAEGKLNVEEVRTRLDQFRAVENPAINLGFDQSVYWLQLSIENKLSTQRSIRMRVDYAFFDDIQLYVFHDDIPTQTFQTGDRLPFAQRPIEAREFIFPIELPPQSSVNTFLRIECNESKQIPVDLFSPDVLQTHTASRFAIYGAIFGSMIIMVFYNLFIWALAREKSYLWYSIYVALTTVYHFAFMGLGFQYVWPNATTWQNYCLPIIGCLDVLSLLKFTRAYLTTATRSPKTDRALHITTIAFVIVTPLSLLFGPQVAMLTHTASVPIFIVLVVWAAANVGLNRYPPGMYFLVSFVIVALSYAYAAIAVTTLLPMGDSHSDLITFILPVTFLIEVVLISFGLAHKIRTLRAEKEIAMKIQLMESERLALLGESARRFVPYEFLQCLDKHDLFEIELGDHIQREMTILFCDIRSFTSLAESLTPAVTFEFINQYLGIMGPVIRGHGGFIDKFIGDAIMALFPRGPDDALNCAIAMDEALEGYNSLPGRVTDPIEIGIGIHTGTLILGTVGDELRLQGTVISDAVNVASRIESLTKKHASVALFSDASHERLSTPEKFDVTELGPVELRGKSKAVTLFSLKAPKTL